ncbi:MAG: flagellar basal-body rod protein FlgF [Lautropia sp.]
MDRMIYLSMSGAKALMQRQDALAQNLANAGTDGFRADLSAFRAVPIRQADAATTRVFSLEATAGFDATPGAIRQTGSALDIAVRGDGWIAVQGADGSEGYTRDGGLTIDAEGTLRTKRGQAVIGDGGPITVPPNAQVTIGSDGSVSTKVGSQAAIPAGRIKLVNPPVETLVKGGDGLVRVKGGGEADADPAVRVADGAVEGSNVNVVESMVGMIEVSRQFEMQMKLMQNAEQNEQRAGQLLAIKG